MELAKLRYEGCTVEVAAEKNSEQELNVVMRIFDPKGKEVLAERGELFGNSLLEWRLIRMLPESEREDTRQQKRILDGCRRKIRRAWAKRDALAKVSTVQPHLKAA